MLLALLVLARSTSFAQSASGPPRASVVTITGVDGEGNTRLGTGFVVDSSGTVVTTHRTLRGLVKATVRLTNGDVHDVVHVRAFDAVKNLAIVQVNAFGLATVALGDSENVSVGTRTSILTHAPPPIAVSVDAVEPTPEGFRVFTFSSQLDVMNAGAPILADDGPVIAMVAARASAPTEPPVGVPINYVRALLAVNERLTLGDLLPSTGLSLPPVTSHVGAENESTKPKVEARTGAVVFYRIRRFVGSALEPSIYCNDQELATMDNGRFFRAALPAGSYVCRSTDQTVVSFDLAPEETRFMRLEIMTGFMKGHGTIREVPAKQGEIEIQKLKPADKNHIKGATLADR